MDKAYRFIITGSSLSLSLSPLTMKIGSVTFDVEKRKSEMAEKKKSEQQGEEIPPPSRNVQPSPPVLPMGFISPPVLPTGFISPQWKLHPCNPMRVTGHCKNGERTG